MTIRPFTIPTDKHPTDKHAIKKIMDKVRLYDWHEMPLIDQGGDRWIYGTDMEYLQELCAYWLEHYDWEKTRSQLNQHQHFICEVDGLDIHFIHEQSANPEAKAVVLTHGWPGSVLEFLEVIAPLAHPEKFGGDIKDGMHIVAPSLPGYGWSGKPARPLGPKSTAALWDRLMVEKLGYQHYIAQGGDWGSVVSGYLGLNHSGKAGGCVAIHLNMYGLRPAQALPQTDEEKNWANNTQMIMELETAYLRLQMTKPQTLSYGMMDSPVGVCAWIIEKFHRWSDRRGQDGSEHIEHAFSKDQLLGNVMIYLLTKSFNTSTWMYRGALEEGFATMSEGERVEVPTAAALFPAEFIPFPPRRMTELGYNIQRWTEFDRGGHFAAMEQADLFIKEIREFIATC